MLIRLPHWGLALLAAGAMWPISAGQAQDASESPATEPAPPRAKTPQEIQDEIEERSIERRTREPRPHKVHDADPWKKNPPVWSLKDVTKEHHPYAHPYRPAPGGGHYPGGPTGRFGQPYYYTATSPDTSGTGGGGPGYGSGYLTQSMGGFGYGTYGGTAHFPATGGYPALSDPGFVDPAYGAGTIGGYGGAYGGGPVPVPAFAAVGGGGPGYGYGPGPGYGYGAGYGGFGGGGMGASFAATPGNLPGDPYFYHFGPGYYRYQEAGHYRFPYYSYRRPWYFYGHTSYNRDTNIPW